MKTVLTLALMMILALTTDSFGQTRRTKKQSKKRPAAERVQQKKSKSTPVYPEYVPEEFVAENKTAGVPVVSEYTTDYPKAAAIQSERNPLETWYINCAIGYAGMIYPYEMQSDIENGEKNGRLSRTSATVDLGIYVPCSGDRKSLLGGSINSGIDVLSDDNESVTIRQTMVSGSAIYYLTGEIGDGFYIRGDFGLAYLTASSSEGGDGVTSEVGTGLLSGAGYAIPVSSGTRMTFNANYSIKTIESEKYVTLDLGVGVLF